MKRNELLSALLIGILSAVVAVNVMAEPGSVGITRDGAEIVARVNGAAIPYSKIRAQKDEIMPALPDNADKETIAKELNRVERRKLSTAIRKAIEDESLKPFIDTVEDEEVRARVRQEMSKGEMADEKMDEAIARINRTIAALSWRLEHGKSVEEAYAQFFANNPEVEINFLKQFADLYDTPEKLERLKAHTPKSKADVEEQAMASWRRRIAMERLREKITKDVAVSDEEIQAKRLEWGKRAGQEAPDDAKITDELLKEKRRQTLAEWWLKRAKEAQIEILAPEYTESLEMNSLGRGNRMPD